MLTYPVVQENNKNVVIVGYSGHSYVLIDSLIESGYNIIGYTDKKKLIKNPFNLKYLGLETDLNFDFFNLDYNYVIGIGDNNLRTKISNYLRSKSCRIINVIHSDSSVSSNIILGTGIFIARNVSVNSFCKIGDNVIINTSASIDHECIIGQGTHIAPGSVLLGNVTVGKNSFVGANSVVKEGVNIGDNVIIGAGSVVLNDVDNNKLIYGNPAK